MKRELAAAHVGIATIGTAGSAATDRDYDSVFLAALESLVESKGEAMTLEWNFAAPLGGEHRGKFQTVLRKPKALGAAVLEKVQDTKVREALLGQLTLSDDVTFTFSISPTAGKGKQEMLEAFSALARYLSTE